MHYSHKTSCFILQKMKHTHSRLLSQQNSSRPLPFWWLLLRYKWSSKWSSSLLLSQSDDHDVEIKPSSTALHSAISGVACLCRYRVYLCLFIQIKYKYISNFFFPLNNRVCWKRTQKYDGVHRRFCDNDLQHIWAKCNANLMDQQQICFPIFHCAESHLFKFLIL